MESDDPSVTRGNVRREDPEKLLDPALRAETLLHRVRWILALDEAWILGRAATWEEWNEIWFRHRPWTDEGAKKAHDRLQRELAAYGLRLDAKVGVYVDARDPKVRALIEPWLRTARRLAEGFAERRQARAKRRLQERDADDAADDLSGENLILHPCVVATEYRDRGKRVNQLAREFGVGNGRVVRLLRSAGVVIRSRKIEDNRPKALVMDALRALSSGASVSRIAALLGCSKRTAWEFLRRHGRARTLRQRRRRHRRR
jgi:phage antirepressor YoqD-like protein